MLGAIEASPQMVVYRNLTKIQNLRYCAIPFFLHQHFYIRADVYVCVFYFMQYKHISFANYTHRQAQQRQGQHLHQQSTRRNKSKNKLCFRYVGYISIYLYIYIFYQKNGHFPSRILLPHVQVRATTLQVPETKWIVDFTQFRLW